VRALRKLFCRILPFLLLGAMTTWALAQEADADQAKALLRQGIAQYKAHSFKAAQATLLRIKADALSGADKKLRNEYLQKVGSAVRKQAEALEAYESAIAAMKAGKLDEAEKGFSIAAGSEYLPAVTRKNAAAQLAEVKAKKKKVQELATAVTPVKKPPATKPAPVAKPVDEKTRRMLADMAARRKKARNLMRLGRKALDNKQPDEAIKYLTQAASLEPDDPEINRMLNYARQWTGTTGNTAILPAYLRHRAIAKQATELDFDKQMKASHEALADPKTKTDFQKAQQAARAARNILETGKSLFSDKEYRDRLRRVEDQERFIKLGLSSWERRMAARQQEELLKSEKERRIATNERMQQKIRSLITRSRNLLAQREYEKSLEVLDQILKIDPSNAWASERKELMENFVFLQKERGALHTRQLEEQKSMVDIRVSEIPWYELMKFPKDWRDITKRRELVGASATSESEADRKVRQRLRQKIAKLDFDDIEFKNVINFLRRVSGANIYVKWKALEAVSIDQSNTVNVHLADVTFEKALRVILQDVGGVTPLSYVIDEGVIMISTKDDLSHRTLTRVYDIRDLIIRVPNFVGPRMDVSNAGNQDNGNNGGGGGGLFGNNDNAANNEEDELIPKSQIIKNIIDMITSTIDSSSWPPTGEVGAIRELHGQLVVTQTAENHQALMNLIEQLREARAIQISIEARFISVSSGYLNSIGLDLDFYFNLGSNLGSNYVRDPATGAITGGQVRDPFTGALVPTRTGTSGWNGGHSNNFTPMGVTQTSQNYGSVLGVATPVANSIGTAVANAALSITGTFLSDIQVDFLLEATQAHQTTRQLTAPRLTLYNGQRAYVTVATQQAYVSGLEPVIADNATSLRPIISFVPTGTVLDVEATVSADRRFVTMTVRPQVSTLNNLVNLPIGTGTVQLPNATIQDLQTTVTVPDGGTLLLGGQKLTGEVEREMGVPLLSKIPILNRAFTNRGKVRDEQTLLILIKPKIIIPSEEEHKVYPE